MQIDYSPDDLDVHADPYPRYAMLREHAPVYQNERAGWWALSRHADVSAALRDSGRFSSANGTIIEPPAWGPNAHLYQSLLAMDPPQHTRTRTLVAACFTRRRVSAMEPLVRRIVNDYLEPALERREFDFISDFAVGVPSDLLSTMLGVPEDERRDVGKLARLAARCEEPDNYIAAARIEATLALSDYYRELVADRTRRRRRDLVSELIDARVAGEGFSAGEIVTFLNALTGAANDTVVHLIASAWYLAWQHPDQAATAFSGAIDAWVAETLRYDTPTQFTARTVTAETQLHGTRIPAGSQLLLLLGAANHDSAVFPEPGRYDLCRDTSKSTGFGKGRHLCLGAGVARLIARVTLAELADRVARYEIDEEHIQRAPASEIRGFVHLPTSVTLR
jgi:cytochrome P450